MKSLNQYITEFVIKTHVNKDSYEPVDLDLSSGTKWCNCNIGANKPEDPGLLFQWGCIDGYKNNDKNNKFLSKDDYKKSQIFKKYNAGDILDKSDDAAYQATKGKYKMPTIDKINELISETNNEWTKLNGVNGRKFISKKDDSKWIFIPAGGYYNSYDNSFNYIQSCGYLWTSSTDNKGNNYVFGFDDEDNSITDFNCGFYGMSIRGICK